MNGSSHPRRPHPDDPEVQIDAVLHALGAVAPSADFSHRINARLRQQADLAPRVRTFSWLPMQLPAVAWLSLAAACAAFMVGAFLLHPSKGSPRELARQAQSSPSRPAVIQGREQNASAADAPAAPAQNSNPAPPGSSGLPPRSTGERAVVSAPLTTSAQPLVFQLSVAASSPSPTPDVPTQASLDAQALDDLHAPSQLAPQLPSTGQERLVRLMLRHGEKHDLAQLDPAERAAFAQQQTREFNSFFNPPVPQPQISLANRVYAPHALTLDEVRQIDAARQTALSTSTTQPPPTGDPK